MRCVPLAVAAALFSLSTVAWAENPWESLMGRKPRVWTDPAGRFSLDLPVGWTAQTHGDTGPVELWRLHQDSGQKAHVTVELRNLPPGVKLAHFGVRVSEEVKKAAKNVQVVEEDRAEIGGYPAIRRLFTHQEAGNAALTDEVVQVIVVAGERGVVITLETALGARGLFWEEFELMMKGFVFGGSDLPLPKTGEGRRRVRAGEMVNPDAVPY